MDNNNARMSTGNADAAADDTEAFSLLMAYPEEIDYYALLGLPRDPPPTDSAIRSAYRTLTLSFHPDKQPRELQDTAKQQFERISEAYETLIHPQKRVVYDLLGAEGVRREWGAGGTMGRGGEAERQQRPGQGQVGVKAMEPEEFKRWFFETMKRRERGVVNSLVRSKGSLIVGINAKDVFSIREVVPDDEEKQGAEEDFAEELVIQAPKISDFAVRYSFVTPFPTLRTLLGEDEKEDEESEQEEGKGDKAPELEIYAGISGHIQRLFQEVELEYDDGETEMRKVPLPLILSTQSLTLGASSSRVFRAPNPKGILKRWPFSFLQNSLVSVDAAVLPATTLQANLAKSFVLAPGTRPFNVVLGTILSHSIFQAPPSLNLQITKGIGGDKIAFCNWSSGFLQWPSVIQTLLAPFAGNGILFENEQPVSQLQVGIMSRATKLASGLADDDEDVPEPDEEDEEYEALRAKQRQERRADEAWQFAISSSPAMNGLVFKYSRNVFSGKAATDVALSQWSSEKHYALPPADEPRSVRLEIASNLSDNLSLGWSIHGSRQVGELTRVGCGVGLQPRGLVMAISWSRLGQTIKLPVAICPIDDVDSNSATLAVLLPWLAYCAIEFGFIRPRERRNRRKMIAQQQKRLSKLVPQKKLESAQAIELMADQVQRRQDKEYSHGGLVITKAEYGHYPKADKNKEPEVTDVTIPVAALVDHGQLVISNKTAKFHILGFHDPAPLKPKTLKIWYQYHGKEHYVQAKNGEGITCPMRSHSVAA
ncbi:J domain-containing protein [Aspergillus undulatus]|uniref:J domain-containing protein n=1 Tax=Aspergillus undulatus TaxID=1810928 RepID=UPI003CCE4822